MNGINAPKVVECLGSDGNKYRQLAKSGNDDLRQDAVCFLKKALLQFIHVMQRLFVNSISKFLFSSLGKFW